MEEMEDVGEEEEEKISRGRRSWCEFSLLASTLFGASR